MSNAPERIWVSAEYAATPTHQRKLLGTDVEYISLAAHEKAVQEAEQRIQELERRLRIPFGKLPCGQCGGPHDFDTSVPSVAWNEVIRAQGLSEYLCTTCIVREFVRVNRSFTATLWNEEFNGVPIEVVVNGQTAQDATAIQEENNTLRARIYELEKVVDELKKENERLRESEYEAEWARANQNHELTELKKQLAEAERTVNIKIFRGELDKAVADLRAEVEQWKANAHHHGADAHRLASELVDAQRLIAKLTAKGGSNAK